MRDDVKRERVREKRVCERDKARETERNREKQMPCYLTTLKVR